MRELGPLSADVLPFPLAGGPLAPLRAATEADGQGDFQPLWSGQAGAMSRQAPAAHIIAELVRQASHLLA
jgi:nitronate monooxygenase